MAEQLSKHHRTTLREIFEHPTSHNVEWRAVLSLLESIGTVDEHRGAKLAVTIGGQTEHFEPAGKKDVDEDTVVKLRHMLSVAGYGPDD
jgi:hypothetical protein